MKILVFDDNENHCRAAKKVLAEHDLVVVSRYDDAELTLTPRVIEAERDVNMVAAGFDPKGPGLDASDEERKIWWTAREKAEKKAFFTPEFDVVLTDLLVPASRKAQGPKGERFVGQEMPLGATIALLALARGVKRVAVVTDASHHDHPASAAFDAFSKIGVATVGDSSILCTNCNCTTLVDEETLEEVSYEFLKTEEGKRKYPQQPDYSNKGTVRVKDWGEILKKLVESTSPKQPTLRPLAPRGKPA